MHLNHTSTSMSKAISIEYYNSMSGNSFNYPACKPHFFWYHIMLMSPTACLVLSCFA